MTPRRQPPRADELFAAACELEGEERESYLADACGEDRALLEEVRSLLAFDASAGDLLESVVSELASDYRAEPAPPRRPAPALGRRLGVYRTTELIDAGGMGSVYLGVRDDAAFEKRVAIKVIKGGVVGREDLRSFLIERQALARLEHPNISRLLDGGTAEDGTPYLVMEYVEGQPIDLWCESEPLGERLRVFLEVCAAVQYAHKNLIVHRDIKPSNVLVTPDGHVKLLDFGIAKILEPEPTTTRTTRQLLTPEYASPEQLRGESITTAADIFSLGVLLYRLLTDKKPFDADTGSVHELIRRVCEEEPPRPSSVAPESMRRRLRGDLDTIVSKALRKEAERRYASVEQLATDLVRCQNGLPVLARPDTVLYLTSKFVSRHRMGVTAILLVIASLIVGIVSATRSARDSARRADVARRVRESMVGLLGSFDPYGPGRGALELEVDELMQEIRDQPRERVDFLTDLCSSWERFHLQRETVKWRRAALAIHENELEADSAAVEHARYELGRTLFGAEQFAEAEHELRRALAAQRAAGTNDAIARTEGLLARLLWTMGDLEQPLGLFESSLERVPDPEIRVELAGFLAARGDRARAEALLRAALSDASVAGEPRVEARIHRRLGFLVWDSPRFHEAAEHFEEALAILHRAGVAQDDLDRLECKAGLALPLRHRASQPLVHLLPRGAVSRAELVFGPDSLPFADACLRYAEFRDDGYTGRVYAGRALEIFRAKLEPLDPDHPRLADALEVLALGELDFVNDLIAEGNREPVAAILGAAWTQAERALAIRTERFGPGDWRTARSSGILGRCLALARHPARADELLADSATQLEAALGPDHPHAVQLRSWRADLSSRHERGDPVARPASATLTAHRTWPFNPHWRDDDGTNEAAVRIDYDDDFVEKTILLDGDPAEAEYARLWIYAQPTTVPGEELRIGEFHHVMVNGDPARTVSFDIGLVFHDMCTPPSPIAPWHLPFFHWGSVRIPTEWLERGPNSFLLYEDRNYASSDHLPREWEFNNLTVGVDTGTVDRNRSWWWSSGGGRPMAVFLDDNPGAEYERPMAEGTYERRSPMELWREALELPAEEIEAARRAASEACSGEAMIFLELVPKRAR